MKGIVIRNGRIWDGARFFPGSLLVREGVVAALGDIPAHSAGPEDFVFDAAGRIVTAGLVDAHIHMRGISSDRYGIPADIACYPFGATAAADAGAERGSAALLDCFGVASVVFVRVPIPDNRPDFGTVERLLAAFGARAVGLKVYCDGQEGLRDIAPLSAVCAYAHARGLRVMVHTTGSPFPMADIAGTLGAGDILTHAFHGGAHAADADGYACLRAARGRGVVIDAGMAGYSHTDLAVLRGAVAAGVGPDVLGSDITCNSAFRKCGRYGITLCMTLARAAGMTEIEVFRAVTTRAARALGREAEWGSLRAGGPADLAVLEENAAGALDITAAAGRSGRTETGYDCLLTVRAGQLVYRK